MRNYNINWTGSMANNYRMLNKWYGNTSVNLLDQYNGDTPVGRNMYGIGTGKKPMFSADDYNYDFSDYSNKLRQYYRESAPVSTPAKEEDYGTHENAFKAIGYAGAILSGLSQLKDKSYLNMASTANRNAALAKSQILQTGIAGTAQANAERERGDRAISQATTGYGTMGVTSDSGSAVDMQAGMAERMERNAQVIQQDAMLKQWALGNEAAQYEAQAKTYQNMARQNRYSGLLNTALNVAKIYFGIGG